MHPHNKALREMIAQHMANLERQLVLEIKYPDDVDDPAESLALNDEFGRLESDTVHNLYAMADLLVQSLHPERYTLHEEAQIAEADKRADVIAGTDAWLQECIDEGVI